MSDLKLAIVTPQGKAYDGTIKQVVVPGELGGFTILRDHAPLIAALEAGVVRVHDGSDEKFFALDAGFLEVHANDVVILAKWAEPAADAQNAAELLKAHHAAEPPAVAAKSP